MDEIVNELGEYVPSKVVVDTYHLSTSEMVSVPHQYTHRTLFGGDQKCIFCRLNAMN